jgi:hypothetical protein
MNGKLPTLFVFILLTSLSTQLFAPISENEPTPTPTANKSLVDARSPKLLKSQRPFAGIWRGTLHMEVSGLGTQKYDDAYTIEIDPTESTITLLSGNSQMRYAVSKQARSVAWSGTENVNMNDQIVTFSYSGQLTLLKDPRSASFRHSTEKMSGILPAKTFQTGIVRKAD